MAGNRNIGKFMPESNSQSGIMQNDLEKNISICLLNLWVWTGFPFANNPSFFYIGYRYLSMMEVK